MLTLTLTDEGGLPLRILDGSAEDDERLRRLRVIAYNALRAGKLGHQKRGQGLLGDREVDAEKLALFERQLDEVIDALGQSINGDEKLPQQELMDALLLE